MTSKLTRERLEKIKSWRETYGAGSNVMLPAEEAEELARMALAAMNSEPVAWMATYHGEVSDDAIGITRSIVEAQAERFGWEPALTEITPLYRHAQPALVIPSELHPDTQKLVTDFCTALAEKLYKAQLKYGYDADWKQDGWPSQCQAHFHQHIAKGDPRDVAAYCAFMWWHGWSTKPAEGLESRTVTVKLPDYLNTYKSPLADEVEHQVRLALELFSSAAGIKWEAE